MATYTKDQLTRYFEHISLPPSNLGRKPDLEFLTELTKRQFANVPFENLSLHYSQTHLLSLDPNDLFEKVVSRRRGGYCMENNTFFGTVLRSLGFSLINAGGRVSLATGGKPGGKYLGLCHMVNLVTIDGQKYLVDVGFGADQPTVPLALIDGYECSGIGPQKYRMSQKSLVEHTDPQQLVWVYSHQKKADAPWIDAYCFFDIEFLPQDFEIMNMSPMLSSESIFKQAVIVAKGVLDTETMEFETVKILFNDEVRKRLDGESRFVEKLLDEDHRIKALEKYFGLKLNHEEAAGIKGQSTELKG